MKHYNLLILLASLFAINLTNINQNSSKTTTILETKKSLEQGDDVVVNGLNINNGTLFYILSYDSKKFEVVDIDLMNASINTVIETTRDNYGMFKNIVPGGYYYINVNYQRKSNEPDTIYTASSERIFYDPFTKLNDILNIKPYIDTVDITNEYNYCYKNFYFSPKNYKLYLDDKFVKEITSFPSNTVSFTNLKENTTYKIVATFEAYRTGITSYLKEIKQSYEFKTLNSFNYTPRIYNKLFKNHKAIFTSNNIVAPGLDISYLWKVYDGSSLIKELETKENYFEVSEIKYNKEYRLRLILKINQGENNPYLISSDTSFTYTKTLEEYSNLDPIKILTTSNSIKVKKKDLEEYLITEVEVDGPNNSISKLNDRPSITEFTFSNLETSTKYKVNVHFNVEDNGCSYNFIKHYVACTYEGDFYPATIVKDYFYFDGTKTNYKFNFEEASFSEAKVDNILIYDEEDNFITTKYKLEDKIEGLEEGKVYKMVFNYRFFNKFGHVCLDSTTKTFLNIFPKANQINTYAYKVTSDTVILDDDLFISEQNEKAKVLTRELYEGENLVLEGDASTSKFTNLKPNTVYKMVTTYSYLYEPLNRSFIISKTTNFKTYPSLNDIITLEVTSDLNSNINYQLSKTSNLDFTIEVNDVSLRDQKGISVFISNYDHKLEGKFVNVQKGASYSVVANVVIRFNDGRIINDLIIKV